MSYNSCYSQQNIEILKIFGISILRKWSKLYTTNLVILLSYLMCLPMKICWIQFMDQTQILHISKCIFVRNVMCLLKNARNTVKGRLSRKCIEEIIACPVKVNTKLESAEWSNNKSTHNINHDKYNKREIYCYNNTLIKLYRILIRIDYKSIT